MSIRESTDVVFRFGPFDANPRTGELKRQGIRLRLPDQSFQILAILLQKPGQMVPREELQAALWPGNTLVDSEKGLNAAINRLREGLGDSADNPRYVETLPRRGYRFVAQVSASGVGAANGAVPQVAHKSKAILNWQLIASAAILVTAGLSVGWFVARPIRHKPLKERRLTANSGEASLKAASISPDGKLLAYADVNGMYLRRVDTAEIKSLPLPAGFDLISVSWFPDNSHLVIAGVAAAGQKPSTWQMSTMTDSFRRLIDDAREAAVSPDGKYIVFLRDNPTASGVEKQIWLAQSDGADSHRLLVEVDALTRFGPVVWSPDGKQLAYLKVRGGPVSIHGSLETIRITSGQPRVILAGPHFKEALCWSQDGRIFYSNAGQQDPNLADTGIWAIPVDEVTGEPKGKPEQITKEPSGISSFSLTADGKRIALLRDNVLPQVFVAEFASGTRQLKTPRRLTLDENLNAPFSWTPDSKAVFFVSPRNGLFNIFKQGIDQPTAELFVGGQNRAFGPRLSPDGSELLYLVAPRNADPSSAIKLMRVSLAGGPPQLVLEEPGIPDLQCARLPSSLCVFFKPGSEDIAVYSLDSVRGKGQEVLRIPFGNYGLSPDGSQIASIRFDEKEGRIRFFSLATKEWRDIVVKGWAGFRTFDWSPDGKTMFIAASNSKGTTSVLDIDTKGNARELLEGQLGWTIPSPDGRYLALTEFVGTNNVWVLEDF
jgi:Tol biopolymer transport system component/DNA-binding winged helix-turn-helix (wHTH) protein